MKYLAAIELFTALVHRVWSFERKCNLKELFDMNDNIQLPRETKFYMFPKDEKKQSFRSSAWSAPWKRKWELQLKRNKSVRNL